MAKALVSPLLSTLHRYHSSKYHSHHLLCRLPKISPSPAPTRLSILRRMESSNINVTTNGAITGSASSATGAGPRFPLPNIPSWVKWAIGTAICIAIPFYKKILRLEGAVAKTEEVVAEVVEEAAEATEKIAADIAKAFPDNKAVQYAAAAVEKFTEEVEMEAKKTDAVTHKVDKITEEVDEVVEPLIKEGESREKENIDKGEKNPSTGLPKASPGASDHQEKPKSSSL